MKIRVLGCGGSFGSPLAWGRNGNIDVNNPHNFRTRSSVLISINNQNILDENGILIIHTHKDEKDLIPNKLKIIEEKKYGLSKIIFLSILD